MCRLMNLFQNKNCALLHGLIIPPPPAPETSHNPKACHDIGKCLTSCSKSRNWVADDTVTPATKRWVVVITTNLGWEIPTSLTFWPICTRHTDPHLACVINKVFSAASYIILFHIVYGAKNLNLHIQHMENFLSELDRIQIITADAVIVLLIQLWQHNVYLRRQEDPMQRVSLIIGRAQANQSGNQIIIRCIEVGLRL